VLDDKIREPSKVQETGGGAFLGAIATFSFPRRKLERLKREQRNLLILCHSVNSPQSDLAEVARTIRAAARGGGAIIGVRSTMPREGTSTVAANLAYSAAAAGQRVLLVDCNVRNADLSRKLAPKAQLGLLDLAFGTANLDEALQRSRSGLSFLPLGQGELGDYGAKVENVLRKCADDYELVVLDLPPLMADIDLGSGILDSSILVVEWGRVPSALAESGIWARPPMRMLFGFVFNKVDPSRIDPRTFPLEHYRWKRANLRGGRVWARVLSRRPWVRSTSSG
jgi:succinoglycan biosynthesis transport protein ExoP